MPSRSMVLAAVGGLVAVAALTPTGLSAQAAARPGDAVAGQYVVILAGGADPGMVAREHARRHGSEAFHVYRDAIRGYAARMSAQAAARVAADPRVAAVELDRVVTVARSASGQARPGGGSGSQPAETVPTGISRVNAPGAGGPVDVDVAIIDTGIDLDHPDLDVVGAKNCSTGRSADDGHGHGTHVAGTVAAIDNEIGVVGVAPGARLYAVRVLDNRGSGTTSSVICGIDWVAANAATIDVANMSLGGSGTDSTCGGSDAYHNAICNAVGKGVTFAVAAGNSATDANSSRPATYEEVITVSALADFNGEPGGGAAPTCRSDVDDTFADFSNFGADVDLIAPGVCILSTWKGGAYETISGTSMASPHVAGAAALYAAANPTASPADVQAALQAAGSYDWDASDDGDNTKEPLLDVTGL